MADDAVGRGVDDAGQQRNASVVHLHRVVEDRAPRGFVVEHDLAGGAEYEQAVHAALQQVLDDARERGIVDLEVVREGRDDGRYDAVERRGKGH